MTSGAWGRSGPNVQGSGGQAGAGREELCRGVQILRMDEEREHLTLVGAPSCMKSLHRADVLPKGAVTHEADRPIDARVCGASSRSRVEPHAVHHAGRGGHSRRDIRLEEDAGDGDLAG